MVVMQEETSRSAGGWAVRLARHYAEMVAAMLLGMVTLHPVWQLLTGGAPQTSWVHLLEVELLVMATAMVVPMAAWMRCRGHGVLPVVEMSAAMYAGFVVLFPLLWTRRLDADDVMVAGHVLMLLLMAVAMLLRRDEYAGACAR